MQRLYCHDIIPFNLISNDYLGDSNEYLSSHLEWLNSSGVLRNFIQKAIINFQIPNLFISFNTAVVGNHHLRLSATHDHPEV